MSETFNNDRRGAGSDRPLAHFLGRHRLLKTEDRIFTEWRLRLWASGVASAYALSLTWRIFRSQSVIHPDGRLICVDFGWIWLSGKFAASSDPVRIFDYSAFSAAQLALFGPGNCPWIPPFDYPPTLLFMTYPLGFMPYLVAFIVWNLATLLLYLGAVFAIISRPVALIVAVTPFFVPVNVDFGHNGFITAALIGFALVFSERRPWLSAPFLGLLTYKPQFGVLFPVALLASRNWRALAGAAAASLLLGFAAAVAFGYQQWPSFIASLFDRYSISSPSGEVELRLHSVFALARWAGAGAWTAGAIHVAIAAATAATIYRVWAKAIPHSLKAAALCVASLVVTPYALFYDLCTLSIGVAFLVKDALARGFLLGERTAILICWAALFLVRVPIGPLICLILFSLVVRRIAAYRADRLTADDVAVAHLLEDQAAR